MGMRPPLLLLPLPPLSRPREYGSWRLADGIYGLLFSQRRSRRRRLQVSVPRVFPVSISLPYVDEENEKETSVVAGPPRLIEDEGKHKNVDVMGNATLLLWSVCC